MTLISAQSRTAVKDLMTLAWPVILARLGIMTMGLTDAIVVGHYASRELAFHSLAWAPSSVVLTTAVGLMMGVQILTARLRGEGRHGEIGAVTVEDTRLTFDSMHFGQPTGSAVGGECRYVFERYGV